MSDFDRQWQKLTALARQAPDDRDAQVPLGFATRVAAQAAAAPVAGPMALFERFALRGLLAAAACCGAAMAFHYLGNGTEQSEDVAVDDSVTALLDIS